MIKLFQGTVVTHEDNLTRRDRILLAVAVVLLFGLSFIITMPAVNAQTITFANPGAYSQRDIAVSYLNGTMAGLYNDTSTIITDGNSSYIFTLVPKGANPMDDFSQWINDQMTWARTNASAVIIFIILIGGAIALVRKVT